MEYAFLGALKILSEKHCHSRRRML